MPNLGRSINRFKRNLPGNTRELGKALSGKNVRDAKTTYDLARETESYVARKLRDNAVGHGSVAERAQLFDKLQNARRNTSSAGSALSKAQSKSLKARAGVGAGIVGAAGAGAAGYKLSRREKSAFVEDFGLEKSAGPIRNMINKAHVSRVLSKHPSLEKNLFGAQKAVAGEKAKALAHSRAMERVNAAAERTAPAAEAAKKHMADVLKKERATREIKGKVIRAYDKVKPHMNGKNALIGAGIAAGTAGAAVGGRAAYKHFKNKEAALYADAIEKIALSKEEEIAKLKAENEEALRAYQKDLKDNGYYRKSAKNVLTATLGSGALGASFVGAANRNPKLAIAAGVPAATLLGMNIHDSHRLYKDVVKPAADKYQQIANPNMQKIRELKRA